jgi:hypothetical protein
MTENKFNDELAKRGFKVVVPDRAAEAPLPWGLIDIGNNTYVNRWKGGSALVDQLAYAIRERERIDKESKVVAKKATASVARKVSKKVPAKKGVVRK